MAESTLPGAAERASGLFADIAEQRWDQACAGFNQQMSERLDATALAGVWAHSFVQPNL